MRWLYVVITGGSDSASMLSPYVVLQLTIALSVNNMGIIEFLS